MDFVRRWSEKTEISAGRFIEWLAIAASKFYDWRERYGKVNEHNGWVPRDFWLEEWEKQALRWRTSRACRVHGSGSSTTRAGPVACSTVRAPRA